VLSRRVQSTESCDQKHASVVAPKSAILWTISGADFGTMSHQCLAGVLIDSKVGKAADPGTANDTRAASGCTVSLKLH
jgi:hypothetical protein